MLRKAFSCAIRPQLNQSAAWFSIRRNLAAEATIYKGSAALPKSVNSSLMEDQVSPPASTTAAAARVSIIDPKPLRFRLKKGEADTMDLTPAMRHVVDLVNASQAELN